MKWPLLIGLLVIGPVLGGVVGTATAWRVYPERREASQEASSDSRSFEDARKDYVRSLAESNKDLEDVSARTNYLLIGVGAGAIAGVLSAAVISKRYQIYR